MSGEIDGDAAETEEASLDWFVNVEVVAVIVVIGDRVAEANDEVSSSGEPQTPDDGISMTCEPSFASSAIGTALSEDICFSDDGTTIGLRVDTRCSLSGSHSDVDNLFDGSPTLVDKVFALLVWKTRVTASPSCSTRYLTDEEGFALNINDSRLAVIFQLELASLEHVAEHLKAKSPFFLR